MKYKIFHISLLLGMLVCVDSALYAQNKQGFVQQEKINIPGVIADTTISKLNVSQKQTSRVYYDGLGRTIQSIAVKASPLQNDLIQPVAYDNLGRQTISYLPYAGKATDTTGFYRLNAISTDQPGFYNNLTQYLTANDGNPYSQQVFENSPLQRQFSSGMVGNGFQPVSGQRYKTAVYRYNSAAQDGSIPVWNYDGTFTASNYYPDNALSVTDGKDEDNTETLVFTNKEGQTVLKRQKLGAANLDTYYIYNMAGMISYVVPPQAVSLMSGSYSLSSTAVKNLVFHYLYDSMGRLIEKKVPSAGTVAIVYDPVNRPVLIQDSNMRVVNKWNYIKYDAKGRVVSQGIYVDASRTTRSSMQAYVNTLASSYNTLWYESRNTSATDHYYTNSVFPSTGLTPLAYAYYDDYDVDNNGSANFTFSSGEITGGPSPTQAALRGIPTVICQTTVGSAVAANTWLTKVTFYDKWGNSIQVQSNNQLSYTAMFTLTDKKTTLPDFTGVPLITKASVQAPSGTTSVQTNFTYDHMYRVTAIDQYYNNSTTVSHVATYSYNELGQIYQKKLAPVSASSYLQSVDMRYNIRGQLLSINNSKLSNDSGQTNGDTNDLFGMQLLYEKVDANLGNTAYYNGKLSAIKWMSRDGANNSSYERAFKYYYDGLNRDTAAIYAERTTASTGAFTTTHGWDEDRITYDLNGNIKTLYRNSTTQGTGGRGTIDNLTYAYDANSPNQLKTVTDASGNANGFVGGSGTYTYDGNGNLLNEPYKGISAISYNVLNRTDMISFSSSANRYIKYAYNASGTLLRKQQYDNVGGIATVQTTTDYIDGFVFTTAGAGTAALQYFNMPEGRVLNNAGTLSQEFTIADQQGNVRIAFDNTGTGGTAKTRQENSYYAFGMIMPGSTVATPGNSNKNLYNGGSEWQNDYANLPDYYQTFYRNYDAALGRWIGVDPKGESAESMTGYQYAGNSPVMMNDPMGDLTQSQWNDALTALGSSSSQSSHYDENGTSIMDELNGFYAAGDYNNFFGSWGTGGAASSYIQAAANYNKFVGASAPQAAGDKLPTFYQSVTWFHGADGKPITQNNTSGIVTLTLTRSERVYQAGVGDISTGISAGLFFTSTTFSLLNENATRNINAIEESNSFWTKMTGKLPGSAARNLEAETFTKTATDMIGKRIFVAGVIYSAYSIYKDHSAGNIAINVADNLIAAAGIWIPGAQIPALIYFGGRFVYDLYKANNP